LEKKTVKGIPEYVIRESVARTPRNFVFGARDPEWDMIYEGAGRKQFWVPSCGATERLTRVSATKITRKRANKDDMAYAAKITDGMDDYDGNNYIFDLGEEGQRGLPTELIKMDTMARSTTKNLGNLCTTVSDIKEFDYVMKLLAAVQGGEEELRKRPLTYSPINPLGTYQLNKYNGWTMRASIKPHFPITPGIACFTPFTGPASIAGLVAVCHAGLLFTTALKEFYDPGTIVLVNNLCGFFDPYSGKGYNTGNATAAETAVSSIWREMYGLPSTQYGGSCAAASDIMVFINTANSMLQTVAGVEHQFIQFADAALDPAYLVAAAEIAHYGRFLMQSLNSALPTKENLALELLKEYGPMGEGWMTGEYNMKRIDTDFYKPLSLDLRAFDTWIAEGGQSWIEAACREKLKEFEKHEPVPVPKDVAEKMDAIVKEGTELLKRKEGGAFKGANPV